MPSNEAGRVYVHARVTVSYASVFSGGTRSLLLAVREAYREPQRRAQALRVLLFLYRAVLEVDLPWRYRAKPPDTCKRSAT